jgi:two-component system, LytTR family, response regulator
MSKPRVFIIDDEPLARDRLRALSQRNTALELAGEFGSGPEAIAAIVQHRPDIIFIDVDMPGCNGLEVVKALPGELRPAVVFVTAHDRFAVEAFAVQAVDYLLKPFDRERFDQATERALAFVQARRSASASQPPAAAATPGLGDAQKSRTERISVKVDGKVVFLRPEEIKWVEAADNYVILHIDTGRRLMVRDTLSSLDERLSPVGFARVNRSAIVNIEQVHELHPTMHGDYTVILRDGTQIPLSRSLRGKLDRFTSPSASDVGGVPPPRSPVPRTRLALTTDRRTNQFYRS